MRTHTIAILCAVYVHSTRYIMCTLHDIYVLSMCTLHYCMCCLRALYTILCAIYVNKHAHTQTAARAAAPRAGAFARHVYCGAGEHAWADDRRESGARVRAGRRAWAHARARARARGPARVRVRARLRAHSVH